MQTSYLLLGGLVTYRISLLISREDGPAYVFRKLRKQTPSVWIRDGLSSEWYMSIWAGVLVATHYWWIAIIPGREWPLYWLALSALGIICNLQWTSGRGPSQANRPASDAAVAVVEKQDNSSLL